MAYKSNLLVMRQTEKSAQVVFMSSIDQNQERKEILSSELPNNHKYINIPLKKLVFIAELLR